MSTGKNADGRRLLKLVANLKLSNILFLLLLIGIVLFAVRIYLQVGLSAAERNEPVVIIFILLTEWLSGAAISTVIVSFAYEWLVRRETEKSLELFLEDQLKQQETTIVNSVVVEIPRALILNDSIQSQLLAGNNTLIEKAIRNFISLRLGDKIMGEGLYEGLLSKSLSYPERYVDYRSEIIISSIHDPTSSEAIQKRFFDVTLNIKYKTRLQSTEFRFARAFNIDQYNHRIRDNRYRYVLLFPKSAAFPEKKSVLDVSSFKIDEDEFNPVETEVDGVHEWVIADDRIKEKINTEITIQYSLSTKTYRYGHSFTANIVKPTHKCLFIFNYARSDIAHVSAYDFFVAAKAPRIYKTPVNNPQMVL